VTATTVGILRRRIAAAIEEATRSHFSCPGAHRRNGRPHQVSESGWRQNTDIARRTPRHRQRMRVILQTDALQAHSMTMYGGWRAVVAEFVSRRLGAKPADLVPQTVAWTMLGTALSAYEHWLADESVSLADALDAAFDTVSDGLRALDGDPARPERRKT